MSSCCLYEQAEFRNAAGDELRPGGLALTKELATLCRLDRGQRVLDLACGVGSSASHLAETRGLSVTGLDSSPRSLEEARRRTAGVSWILGRAEELPFEDQSFDAVFCECFLSLVEDLVRVLSEIGRVLRRDGRLALTDVYLRSPHAAADMPAATVLNDVSAATVLAGVPAESCLRGAVGHEATISRLEQAGFSVSFWADRSAALKVLAARMVFAYGSVGGFWDAVLGDRASSRNEVVAARPGYYIAVAQRGSATGDEA